MDKVNMIEASLNHLVSITDRKSINITGVKKIESFDVEEFLLETTHGFVIIKGEELELIKFDTYQGNVSIKGKVNSFSYVDELGKSSKKEDGIFSRLFK